MVRVVHTAGLDPKPMDEPTPPANLRPPCPQCATLGAPWNVTFGSGNRVITFKCPFCGHQWTLETHDHEKFLRPSHS